MQSALTPKRVRVLSSPPIAHIIKRQLDVQLVAEADIYVVPQLADTTQPWALAVTLGKDIQQHYDAYDGFVIVQPADVVLATSNLLSFLFRCLGKPIIFTGIALPAQHYDGMDLQINFLTALQVATMNCSGVFLAYGHSTVRAVRALEQFTLESQAFASVGEPAMANVQFGVHLHQAIAPRSNEPIVFEPDYSTAVWFWPVLPEWQLPNDLAKHCRAIVITGYKNDPLPTDLILPSDVPVLLPGHAPQQLADNIVYYPYATPMAMLTKAMVVLTEVNSMAEFLEHFKQSWQGEFSA